MADSDDFEIPLTDERVEKVAELTALYFKLPPEDMAQVKYDADKLSDWLISKHTAYYLMIMAHANTDPEEAKDWGLAGTAEDCLAWSKKIAEQADAFFVNRLNQLFRAALRKAVEELTDMLPYFDAKLNATEPEAKRFLPTKAEIESVHSAIEEAYSDLSWAREGRGGARRTAPQLPEQDKRKFAARVGALMTVWNFIADFLKTNGYDAGCLSMLKESERFNAVTAQTGVPPDNLIRKFFRERKPRFEDGEKIPRDLQPQTFAIVQAAIEHGLSRYSLKRLRVFYRDGRKALVEGE